MKYNENILYDNNGIEILKTFHSIVDVGKRFLREHHHTECELSLFISGSGTYSVNGIEYSFSSGDMFLFGSNEPHCITNISTPLNLMNIHFEPRILWENPENIELLHIFNMRNSNFTNKFPKSDTTLKEIIVNIEKEISKKNKGYSVQTKCFLFSALIHIMREYDYIKTDESFSLYSSTAEKLAEATTYINSNLETKLNLKEIADIACMTPTYFSAIFKKFNGISPWEYITIKRVENAIQLIKTTNLTKLEIAEKCGFSSPSNFYKIFFKITGKRPGEYVQK